MQSLLDSGAVSLIQALDIPTLAAFGVLGFWRVMVHLRTMSKCMRRIDRRVLRVETKLGIEDSEI